MAYETQQIAPAKGGWAKLTGGFDREKAVAD
jgi:hypothetical protein